MKTKLSLPNASSKYGASMGRRNHLGAHRDLHSKLHLQKMPMVEHGAYDKWGAYWGQGETLWVAFGRTDAEPAEEGEEIYFFTRAQTRNQAKVKTQTGLPNARFYR